MLQAVRSPLWPLSRVWGGEAATLAVHQRSSAFCECCTAMELAGHKFSYEVQHEGLLEQAEDLALEMLDEGRESLGAPKLPPAEAAALAAKRAREGLRDIAEEAGRAAKHAKHWTERQAPGAEHAARETWSGAQQAAGSVSQVPGLLQLVSLGPHSCVCEYIYRAGSTSCGSRC